MYLTRRATFSAAHRLWSEALSPDENERIFGMCARQHGHGHNYTLEVTVRGHVNSTTGIVVNLLEMQEAINSLIIKHVDHRHLNHDSVLCEGVNPTCENLAYLFWCILRERLGDLLYEIRLYETEDNYAVYRGER